MIEGKKVVVVMPAYNAEKTLRQTHDEVKASGVVDLIILVDDCSRDDTVGIARSLPDTVVHAHQKNRGYGGNQKTCYRLALNHGADIVIMVHPDYQYTPKLIPAMASLISCGLYHFIIGSPVLGGQCSMSACLYGNTSQSVLRCYHNFLLGAKHLEYHSGCSAWSLQLY